MCAMSWSPQPPIQPVPHYQYAAPGPLTEGPPAAQRPGAPGTGVGYALASAGVGAFAGFLMIVGVMLAPGPAILIAGQSVLPALVVGVYLAVAARSTQARVAAPALLLLTCVAATLGWRVQPAAHMMAKLFDIARAPTWACVLAGAVVCVATVGAWGLARRSGRLWAAAALPVTMFVSAVLFALAMSSAHVIDSRLGAALVALATVVAVVAGIVVGWLVERSAPRPHQYPSGSTSGDSRGRMPSATA